MTRRSHFWGHIFNIVLHTAQEYVIKGFGDKVPKAAAAALDIVSLALR